MSNDIIKTSECILCKQEFSEQELSVEYVPPINAHGKVCSDCKEQHDTLPIGEHIPDTDVSM